MSNTYRIIHYFIAFVGHTVEMPIYKDASDVIRRKNAMTIYTNIKKQKDDLEKGLIQKVLYQGGCDSTGTFILTQMKNGSIYSSDMEIEVIAAQQAYSRQIEATRIEAARIEAERLESERIEAARIEAARIEAARIEAARIEAARIEAERLESERIEAERLESERIEAERLESERIEAARIEAERLESESIEAKRLESERIEAARIESERIEAKRLESERIESERIESERIESERIESERIESERIESERIESERIESERIEAQNTQPPITQEPLKQIKVLILGDITIGLKAIQIKTELMAEYTKVKADICILGTTYDGSHVYEYDRVYYYPTPTHTGAPSLQQNIDSYVKNGGIILSV
jgi:hypothetical protein